jgi:chromosome partitioning protein
VLGNEKGGSGKSTTCMHIAIALLKAGQRVATIDVDSRQKSLTRYVDNRKSWAKRAGLLLEIPTHYCIARGEGSKLKDNEAEEFSAFAQAITAAEHDHDFILIDTPGTDSYPMRLAHAMADTLVTPLNDSFVDFDVLGTIDSETFTVTGISQYGDMVREARRQRRTFDGGATDWVVMRNRVALVGSRNKRMLAESLNELGLQMGFRIAEGLAERVVYREFFPRGLTVLDDIDESLLGVRASNSHATAREEVQHLLETLKLPLDERGRRRAAARAEWFAALDKPLETHDIIAE